MDEGLSILVIFVSIFIGFIFGVISGEGEMKTQAIDRGYALYCPSSGNFAWQGERE
jgi:hypothetical protein